MSPEMLDLIQGIAIIALGFTCLRLSYRVKMLRQEIGQLNKTERKSRALSWEQAEQRHFRDD